MVELSAHLPGIETIAIKGPVITGQKFRVHTDSRRDFCGGLFICLSGENFDGFQFVEDVLRKKAEVIVYEYSEKKAAQVELFSAKFPDVCFVAVADSLVFLQSLARLHRQQWYREGRHVIGITGSNGKTTTKEMLSALLTNVCGEKVYWTSGNLNNHIGVPLTLLELTDQHEIAIVEMGMNHQGEISFLCDIAYPTSGIVTNIGTAHIEFLKTQENIFKEKLALMDAVLANKEPGYFILNSADEFLKTVVNDSPKMRTMWFKEITHQGLSYERDGQELRVVNRNIFGQHLYTNLALCLELCLCLFPKQVKELTHLANEITLPANNRTEWREKSGKIVFLDAYNANPNSMRASLELFCSKMDNQKMFADERLFVLGDMNELGEYAPEMHKEIGRQLSALGAVHVAFIGRYARDYQQGFPKGQIFTDKESFRAWYEQESRPFGAIFLKGSRSLQLESLADIV